MVPPDPDHAPVTFLHPMELKPRDKEKVSKAGAESVPALPHPVGQPWGLKSSVPCMFNDLRGKDVPLQITVGLVTDVLASGMAMPWCYRIEVTSKAIDGFTQVSVVVPQIGTNKGNLPFHLQIETGLS